MFLLFIIFFYYCKFYNYIFFSKLFSFSSLNTRFPSKFSGITHAQWHGISEISPYIFRAQYANATSGVLYSTCFQANILSLLLMFLLQIIKHLPKSSDIICATVDKDEVHREKAFLFVKNHSDKWHPTNFSAGREYCCKDYLPAKCTKKS